MKRLSYPFVVLSVIFLALFTVGQISTAQNGIKTDAEQNDRNRQQRTNPPGISDNIFLMPPESFVNIASSLTFSNPSVGNVCGWYPLAYGASSIFGYRMYRDTYPGTANLIVDGSTHLVNSAISNCANANQLELGFLNGAATTIDGTYWIKMTSTGSPFAPDWANSISYYFEATRSGGVWSLGPAAAMTRSALNITQTSFRMNGSINPNGVSTQGYFEYGIDPALSSFNTSTKANYGGANSINLSTTVNGGSCNSTYYYRAVAKPTTGNIVRGSIVAVTTAGCATPVCPVEALTPITDPLAQQFENGNTLDTTRLAPAMQTAYSNFRNAIAANGGNLTLNSAYRPAAYQLHLREVWDKWQALLNNPTPQCQNLLSQVQAEVNRHTLSNLRTRPAGASGHHPQGLAIDVNYAETGLPLQTILNLGIQNEIVRPPDLIYKDPNHFILASQLRNGNLKAIEEDGEEAEGSSNHSQVIQTISTDNVFITITKQIVNNNYVYFYRVQNNAPQPIRAFEVGYNDSTNSSHLLIPPVNWSYETGLEAGSTTSPTEWSSNLITTEENEFHSIEWRTGNSNQNIQPLQSLSGFSVVLPEDDVTYRTSCFRVVFADGSTASAQPVVSVSGRVLNSVGRAIRGAIVTITNTQTMVTRTTTTRSFGDFQFLDVEPGATYTIAISQRRYLFEPQTLLINDNLTNLDFIGMQPSGVNKNSR